MASWKEQFDRAVATVGQGLETVAGEAVRVAGEAGKVAGIGVGTIEFDLAQKSFEPGQCVTGVVRVRLTEPTSASRIAICLRATRDRYAVERRNGSTVRVHRTEVLHDYTCELVGEATYLEEDLAFAVHIPEALEERVEVDGVLGDVLKVADGLRSLTQGPVSWKLSAFVEIPWKRNVSKSIDLSVR